MAEHPRVPEALMVVAQVFDPQSVGLAARAVAVEALPVTAPVSGPLNPVAVKIPVEGTKESLVEVVFCGKLPVLAVTQVG